MMKKTAKMFIKELRIIQKSIAKERDSLSDAISEMEMLKEDCIEAWDSLQEAMDSLSKLQ
jgi:hypothetical protein